MRAAHIARGPRAAPAQRARPAARPPAKCSPPKRRLSTGALHIGSAPASAAACVRMTHSVCTILFLLSCDWSQLAECKLVPPHAAPPAHLGKPSPISKPFFVSCSSPQPVPADVGTISRPEKNFHICGYRTSFPTGLFRLPRASGWPWSSWHPPTPPVIPVTPLPPCTHAFAFHCMCTQHTYANFPLHTPRMAATSDLFVKVGTNGTYWVHWAPPRRDIHQFHPFSLPWWLLFTAYSYGCMGSASSTHNLPLFTCATGHPVAPVADSPACDPLGTYSRGSRRNPDHFRQFHLLPRRPRLQTPTTSSNHPILQSHLYNPSSPPRNPHNRRRSDGYGPYWAHSTHFQGDSTIISISTGSA